MVSAESLLKLSDFPFSYSFLSTIAALIGFDIMEKYISFLIIAGFFGTFLTITDPVGLLMRRTILYKLHRIRYPESIDQHTEAKIVYTQNSINAKPIGIEIDKIVSLFYFAIVLGSFSTALTISDSFAERFLFYTDAGKILCPLDCIRNAGIFLSAIAIAILGLVVWLKWQDMFKKVQIIGIQTLGIYFERPQTESLEKLSRAIDENNWDLAQKWADKLEEEIKREREKSSPILRIEVNKPNEPLPKHSRLLTFKIWNRGGGGESAKNVKVFCRVEGQSQEEYAVKWHSAQVPFPTDIENPDTQQLLYSNSEWFIASEIDHDHYETIELLFTTNRHEQAYFLDSNHTRLTLGKHYTITLKVVATDLKAHAHKFDIDLTRWDVVNAAEIL